MSLLSFRNAHLCVGADCFKEITAVMVSVLFRIDMRFSAQQIITFVSCYDAFALEDIFSARSFCNE